MTDEVLETKVEETVNVTETTSVKPKRSEAIASETSNTINTLPKDITDKEIFSNLKNKLSKKFGDDVVNSIENNYSKGLKYDISVKENMEDEIMDNAYRLFKDAEIAKKQNNIYKTHELSREEGDKIIKEMIKYDPDLQEDMNLDPEYLSSPANLNRVLKKYKQQNADKNIINNFGAPQEKYNIEKREAELIAKGRNMNSDEMQEYKQILQYKLNKQS
jgi:hypothetical protein